MKKIKSTLKFLLFTTGTLICCHSLHGNAADNTETSVWGQKPAGKKQVDPDVKLLAEVFKKIKSDYIEPVDNFKLIKGCESRLSIPEASIRDDPKFQDDVKAGLEMFHAIVGEAKDRPPEFHSRTAKCLEGMVSSLDDRSRYINEEEWGLLLNDTKSAGIGIELKTEEGKIKIVSAVDDTPAAKAGVKAGDIIHSIDDAAEKPSDLDKTIHLLRGEAGSTVKLTVERQGVSEPISLLIQRSLIKVIAVKYDLPKQDYGYIRISQLSTRTTEDLAKAINLLNQKNQRPLKGMVLDLRDNSGGLLSTAVGVAAVFLPKDKLIVDLQGRTKNATMKLTSDRMNYIRDQKTADLMDTLPASIKTIPMVVLINHNSAAGTEIVAAALQDHKRATIMGSPSYGVGTVQTIFPTPDSQAGLKLTTSKVFSPLGRSFDKVGITPDVVLPEEGELNAALDYLAKLSSQ